MWRLNKILPSGKIWYWFYKKNTNLRFLSLSLCAKCYVGWMLSCSGSQRPHFQLCSQQKLISHESCLIFSSANRQYDNFIILSRYKDILRVPSRDFVFIFRFICLPKHCIGVTITLSVMYRKRKMFESSRFCWLVLV